MHVAASTGVSRNLYHISPEPAPCLSDVRRDCGTTDLMTQYRIGGTAPRLTGILPADISAFLRSLTPSDYQTRNQLMLRRAVPHLGRGRVSPLDISRETSRDAHGAIPFAPSRTPPGLLGSRYIGSSPRIPRRHDTDSRIRVVAETRIVAPRLWRRDFQSTSRRNDIFFASFPALKSGLLNITRVSLVFLPFVFRYKYVPLIVSLAAHSDPQRH